MRVANSFGGIIAPVDVIRPVTVEAEDPTHAGRVSVILSLI